MCRLTPLGVWKGKLAYDPYEALGVSPYAPQESIRQAYRVKARVCHPDKLHLSCTAKQAMRTEGGTNQEHEEEPFVIISAAYEMLRKPEHRRQFDTSGSGDGGRFVKRGHIGATARKKSRNTVVDIVSLFAEGLHFSSEGAKEEADDDEDDDSLDFGIFGVDDEEDEADEEEEEGFNFEWDFSIIADLF